MSNLHYVIRNPKKTTAQPPLLILLHGYGSNELDLFSFADELPDDLLIISARAPYDLGFTSYAWYVINFDADNNKFTDTQQAKESVTKIASFIDDIKQKYNTNPNKTFLLGFSQGAILSYALSFIYPNKVQYVLALSGYIHEEILPTNINESKTTTDYYISHGTADQVIPISWAKKAPELLNKHNLSYQYSEYPVGHGIAPQNFFSLKKWIEERL